MAKETITMTRDLYDEMLEAVATKERERIIKLLEDYSNGETLISVDVAIALIKGDNKLTYEAIIAEIQKSTDILIKGENK